MDGVLHHDHRTIDDHAKINRPQAHQIRTEAEEPHIDEADEHRQRNNGGCNQRRARVAEEDKENDGDKNESLANSAAASISGRSRSSGF
jgi:hypothetical protein